MTIAGRVRVMCSRTDTRAVPSHTEWSRRNAMTKRRTEEPPVSPHGQASLLWFTKPVEVVSLLFR